MVDQEVAPEWVAQDGPAARAVGEVYGKRGRRHLGVARPLQGLARPRKVAEPGDSELVEVRADLEVELAGEACPWEWVAALSQSNPTSGWLLLRCFAARR